MPLALKHHPDSPCRAVRQIEVDVARPRPDGLLLSYRVTGTISDVLIPPVLATARRDQLWHHTCFEAFVRAPSAAGYYEINLSPSTQWAAYRFSAHRSGMHAAEGLDAPRIEVQSEPQSFTLRAALDLRGLPELVREVSWQVGLSAIIEDADGGMSYWALAHPPGKPDFHHADCFALELSPAVAS
jgi:hypothetical protein